jgi:hypothetical protein
MKTKLVETLKALKEQGELLFEKANKVSNTAEIDVLIADYHQWNSKAMLILEKSFVQKQLFNMFKGAPYLGNSYIDANSFQAKRDMLFYCLPKKSNHLVTAINIAESSNERDLLPIEEEVQQQLYNNPKITPMKKIFISHSSNDSNIIKPIIDLLIDIGIQHNQIFYSSHPAYGVGLGENILERIKQELNTEVVVFFILSENFYKSPVCLCEMGATWIKTNKHIPILIPPFDFNQVKGVFPNSLGFKINDKDQLNTLKTYVEEEFSIKPIHLSIWEEKRTECLDKINASL